MYSVCIAPYPPGTQPVTKTLCKSPTGPALQHFAADFLRFTNYKVHKLSTTVVR